MVPLFPTVRLLTTRRRLRQGAVRCSRVDGIRPALRRDLNEPIASPYRRTDNLLSSGRGARLLQPKCLKTLWPGLQSYEEPPGLLALNPRVVRRMQGEL